MKQVVFAIALLAMASLTGCLNGDDPSDSEDLINPVDAYEPPKISSIMVDYGITGGWDCDYNDNDTYECEYISCTKQGYQYDLTGDGTTVYCDIDGHYNYGPQVIVNKTGNKVTIECIKSNNTQYCKGSSSVYIIFTSIEGLQERIYCYMFDGAHQGRFHKCEATLGFEPASFESSSSGYYFGYKGSEDADFYYNNVVFRVF